MAADRSALDALMDQASRALVAMDYLEAEALGERALAAAYQQQDWSYFARIVLPLQEARRQRRLIAAEGVLRLGTGDLAGPVEAWLERAAPGCLVVTRPHTADDALALLRAARARRLHVEVLYADSAADEATWRLRAVAASPEDRALGIDRPAPPGECVDKWLADPADARRQDAAQWFTAAGEALGDDLIAKAAAVPQGQPRRVDLLLAMTALAPDHEKLHQRLAEAARALRGGGDLAAVDQAAVDTAEQKRAAARARAGRPRRRRPLVLLVLAAVLLGAAGWAWTRWNRTPAFWTHARRQMASLTPAQRLAIATSVEQRVVGIVTKFDPDEDPLHPTDRTLEITVTEANAWATERLPMWLAHRGAAWPPGLTEPTVAVDDGQVIAAAQLATEPFTQVFSIAATPVLDDRGMLRLTAVRVRGGELPLPTSALVDRFAGQTPPERVEQVQALRQLLAGAATEAVYDPGDDRQARFTAIEVRAESVVLTFHHERKAKKK